MLRKKGAGIFKIVFTGRVEEISLRKGTDGNFLFIRHKRFYYINTSEIPGFFLLLKNHIFIVCSEDTIFIFHTEDIFLITFFFYPFTYT